jgi:bacterioferritin-associated ferredoxin
VYACICHAVSERELAMIITAGARTQEDVSRACGAGTGCGSCVDRICDRLAAAGSPGHRLGADVMAAS